MKTIRDFQIMELEGKRKMHRDAMERYRNTDDQWKQGYWYGVATMYEREIMEMEIRLAVGKKTASDKAVV